MFSGLKQARLNEQGNRVGWTLIAPKKVLRPIAGVSAPIKNTASLVVGPGLVPAFSASGQDVFLPRAIYDGDGIVLSAVGARCGKTFLAKGKWAVVANTQPFSISRGHNASFWWLLTNIADFWERGGAAQPYVRVPASLSKKIAIPEADEQSAIVKYLSHAHRQIDRAIAAKRKLIALLEEQKQATIHEAVTRGLDPAVPLKDSGIPWLGTIPAHWVVQRAKHVLREVDERSTSGAEEQLSVSHLTGVSPRKATVTMFLAESYVGHKICQPNDLVVNTMWAWMGALGIAHETGIVSPSYGVYRMLNATKMIPAFLDLLLRTPRYISYFKSESTGIRSSRLRLYPDQVGATPLPIPPLAEQEDIVAHLNAMSEDFATVKSKSLAEIELLREFRTRLTSDVVTGQVDVREIAATLPELTENSFIESVDDLEEDDELSESELEFVGADE